MSDVISDPSLDDVDQDVGLEGPPSYLPNMAPTRTAFPTYDSVTAVCKPLPAVAERMSRSEAAGFHFVHLAQAHFCGLAFLGHGFPGYEQMEILLARATERASNIVKLEGSISG